MSETLETVLRASVRTLAAAAGLSPSRMHQLGKLTVLQTLPRNAVTSANAAGVPGLRTYLTHDESRHHRVSGPIAPIHEPAASPASAPAFRSVDTRTGIPTRSDQSVTSAGIMSAVHVSPENCKAVHPCGSQRGSQPNAVPGIVTPWCSSRFRTFQRPGDRAVACPDPSPGSGWREYSYGGFGGRTPTFPLVCRLPTPWLPT
jgi:hypothetical protein